jgi:hypothetical protein
MRKHKVGRKVFRSFQEYRKEYFPSSTGGRKPLENPEEQGTEMAHQALQSLRKSLS